LSILSDNNIKEGMTCESTLVEEVREGMEDEDADDDLVGGLIHGG